jgi:hypothetical protein
MVLRAGPGTGAARARSENSRPVTRIARIPPRPTSLVEKIVLALYVLCFTTAAAFHAIDLIRWGWLPYTFAPAILNWFWALLTVADPLAVLLLLTGRRRMGLCFALVVMILDVAANGYAFFGLGYREFAVALQLQAAFLGFILGSIGFLWKRQTPGAC